MRIAKADYYDEKPDVKVLLDSDYVKLKDEVKKMVDTDSVADREELIKVVLIDKKYGSKNHATGSDVDKAIKELTAKIIDKPAEYDEDGELTSPEESHYDYKSSDGLFLNTEEE